MDLTQSAIDALLGALTSAIQKEARLIGNVHRDMKFIKDEMDSMNGFLRYLNKMDSEHDDQVRAWMKQVREVSYIAEDCVDRYVRVVARDGDRWDGGCPSTLAFCLKNPRAFRELTKLGEQIAELKDRVRDVGERRQRYGVSVPPGRGPKTEQSKLLPGQEEEKRKAFVHELEKDAVGSPAWFRSSRGQHEHAPGDLDPLALGALLPADGSRGQLPGPVIGPSEAATMRAILNQCCPTLPADEADVHPDEAAAFRCTRKMFLCAMYVYPYPTSQELNKLKDKVVGVAASQEAKEVKKDEAVVGGATSQQAEPKDTKGGKEAPGDGAGAQEEDKQQVGSGVGAQEARKQVMIFCYSILTTEQKSCLQYLTAFLYESEISRTSMVRRWVAEGLVGKEPGGGGGISSTTPEEAGELCFGELLLRGFVRAARWSDAGTVKSCVMDGPVSGFVQGMTKTENFVAELPAHLNRQLNIRRIVQLHASMSPPPPKPVRRRCNLRCCGGASSEEDAIAKDPMDELVEFIGGLPELYRLNVLDLGGCTGLKTRHLKSFAKVECLKYLSLRSTDVSRLHAKHINKLTLLETLDIRETNIPHHDTIRIHLPKLKHLLAGRFIKTTAAEDKASLVTVDMPDSIGSMREMETLSHVQVSVDGAELQGVAQLHKLRKLGVVVHANTATAALLGRVLYMLAANLRSLSIWVAHTTQHGHGGGTGILDVSSMHEMASSLALENLGITGKMSLPSWIGRAAMLANVTLRDTEMDGGDALRRLATVQSLRCLKLSRKAFTEQALRFKDVQFQALKFLVVEGDAVTRVSFFVDAAPKLEKIVWAIRGGSKIAQMYNEDLIVGIDFLPLLKEIELRASFKLTNLSEWTKQQATSAKPRLDTSATPSDTSAKPRYCIRYISSSDGQLITELQRSDHTTLSLPAGVIN